MRSIITAQPESPETVMIVDMEAGLEHLSRSTTRGSDIMLAVAEPYYKSLETAARVTQMAKELGIPQVYILANKVRTPGERQAIQAFCQRNQVEILATIPYDEQVAEASLLAASALDLYPGAAGVAALADLSVKLSDLYRRA